MVGNNRNKCFGNTACFAYLYWVRSLRSAVPWNKPFMVNIAIQRLLTDEARYCRWRFLIDDFLPSTRFCDRQLFDTHTHTSLMLSITKVCRSLNMIDSFSLFKRENESVIFCHRQDFCYNLLSMTRLTHGRNFLSTRKSCQWQTVVDYIWSRLWIAWIREAKSIFNCK